jgi:hypothetical protein
MRVLLEVYERVQDSLFHTNWGGCIAVVVGARSHAMSSHLRADQLFFDRRLPERGFRPSQRSDF